MPEKDNFNCYNHVADFGEALTFNFRTEDGKYYYPQISLDGPEGTTAVLHGQHMSPNDIEKLGLALMQFAAKLRASK